MQCLSGPVFQLPQKSSIFNLHRMRKEKVRIVFNVRVYLEHNGAQELKLYFSTIEESDAGTYTCQGRIDGNIIQKTIRLNLFSKFNSVTLCSICSVSSTQSHFVQSVQ